MKDALVCILESRESQFITDLAIEKPALEGLAELRLLVFDTREVAVSNDLARADALIVSHHPWLSAAVIESLQRARVIVRNGAGFDNINISVAREQGIPVCNVPDYGTEEVADHTLLLTLALQRRLRAGLSETAKGCWKWSAVIPGHRLRGQVFGIVGCGRIGTATAMRAQAFGFRVVFYDPYVAVGYEKALGVERVSRLEELLRAADVLSIHTPLTAETRGMLDGDAIRMMRRGVLLVNTARGGIVKEAAALEALGNGRLGGLALDVVEQEPLFDSGLLRHSNCIITPHMAFYSEEAIRDMREGAAGIVRAVLTTGAATNVVNGVAPRSAVKEVR